MYDPFATSVNIPRWSVKTLDRSIESMDISLGEIKQIRTIDEIPEPYFLKYDVRSFIPEHVTEKAAEVIREVKHWFDVPIDKIKEIFEKAEPVDRVEFANWMYEVAACKVLSIFVQMNYNESNNSVVFANAGDGFIPGVRVENIRFNSIPAWRVVGIGYAPLWVSGIRETIGRRINPSYVIGGKSIIKKSLLSYAHAAARKDEVQWSGVIFKWKRLASTIGGPVRNLVCINYGGENGVNPQFFLQATRNPVKLLKVVARFWSRIEQRIRIKWRNPRNYEQVVYNDFIDVPAGESELTASFGSYPSTPPLVCEIQPENGNFSLKSYEVSVVTR